MRRNGDVKVDKKGNKVEQNTHTIYRNLQDRIDMIMCASHLHTQLRLLYLG